MLLYLNWALFSDQQRFDLKIYGINEKAYLIAFQVRKKWAKNGIDQDLIIWLIKSGRENMSQIYTIIQIK